MVGTRGFEHPTSPANIDGVRGILNLHQSCAEREGCGSVVILCSFQVFSRGANPRQCLRAFWEYGQYAHLSSFPKAHKNIEDIFFYYESGESLIFVLNRVTSYYCLLELSINLINFNFFKVEVGIHNLEIIIQ